jgi:ATP synthase mitochondrial F1 complex assembly factor 1
MIIVSAKYPVFVVPVLQMKKGEAEVERAHEFYFLQWGFHGAPPTPGIDDPFCTSRAVSSSPQISTILFTPLQEYKIRAAFATPYLVLTFYTDLASSHGIVLMRGEITPGTESEGRHLLNQEDAQLLAMQVQKFYLWGEANDEEKGGEGERLLKEFHEKPQEFKWEELLKHGDLSV